MDSLDLDSIEQPRERWLSCGKVEFLVRYCSPREADTFRRRMIQDGVLRHTKDGVDVNPGREGAYYKAFAEQYVIDWRGPIKPEGTVYSADRMGRVLANRGDIKLAIEEAVTRAEAFFVSNGTGPT